MTIELRCGKCSKQYRVGDDKAGKRFKCKECGNPINIPELDDGFDDFGGDDWGDGGEDWGDSPYGSPMSAPKKSNSSSGKKKSSSGKKKKSSSSKQKSKKRKTGGSSLGAALGIVSIIVGTLALAFSFIPCFGAWALWPAVISATIGGVGLWLVISSEGAPMLPTLGVLLSLSATGMAFYQYQQVKEVTEVLLGGTERDEDGWFTKLPEDGSNIKQTTAEELGGWLNTNRETAKENLAGSWVEITGKISAFDVPDLDSSDKKWHTRFTIRLDDNPDAGTPVSCEMAGGYVWRKCRVGDTVTIKGVFNPGILSGDLERCTLIKAGQGVPQMTAAHLMESVDWEADSRSSPFDGQWCEVQCTLDQAPDAYGFLEINIGEKRLRVRKEISIWEEDGVSHEAAFRKLAVGQTVIFLGKIETGYDSVTIDPAIIVR